MELDSSLPVIDNFIAGTFLPPSTGNYIHVINPATGMFCCYCCIVLDQLSK